MTTAQEIAQAVADVDWYADCGPDYVAPVPEVVRRAEAFVIALAAEADSIQRKLELPAFSPGADGSVDVHWGCQVAPGRELLLSFRHASNVATFFGQRQDGTSIKGSLGIDGENAWLAAWLSEPTRDA